MDSVEQKIRQVYDLISPLLEDVAVPRNIRKAITEAREKILTEKDNPEVAVANTIYLLEEVSNDINMPLHARTDIWNIISELEKIKEELKTRQS